VNRNQRFRLLDLTVLAASAPIWVPVMAACAAAVAIGSGRPAFFRQERVGLDGVTFQVLKFRSMRVSDRPEAPSAATITRVGAVLRRTSLDELPQLLNVLRGEMSLVGPRPMLPRQVAALSCGQERRHLVRPGLTGLAQVNFVRLVYAHDNVQDDAEHQVAPVLRLEVRERSEQAERIAA